MKKVRQVLANLTGQNVNDINYRRLANLYEADVRSRDAEDEQNAIEHELKTNIHSSHVDVIRKTVADAIEKCNAEIDGRLPIVSTFEALQIAKSASKQHSRDIGVLNLVTFLDKKWKSDKEANLNTKDVLLIQDHFAKSYPKSAAVEVIKEFSKKGYTMLPIGKLMDIASNIRSQDDFDYYVKEAGLDGNNPFHRKSRKFILALLNDELGEAPDEDEMLLQQYSERADAARAAGWVIEFDPMMPTLALYQKDDPNSGYFFQEHEVDRLLGELPDFVKGGNQLLIEDFLLAQAMEW
ncbi:hypothetical protein N8Z24_00050 [bacterium]|nr:hypothetical protein [bacterium]